MDVDTLFKFNSTLSTRSDSQNHASQISCAPSLAPSRFACTCTNPLTHNLDSRHVTAAETRHLYVHARSATRAPDSAGTSPLDSSPLPMMGVSHPARLALVRTRNRSRMSSRVVVPPPSLRSKKQSAHSVKSLGNSPRHRSAAVDLAAPRPPCRWLSSPAPARRSDQHLAR